MRDALTLVGVNFWDLLTLVGVNFWDYPAGGGREARELGEEVVSDRQVEREPACGNGLSCRYFVS